MPLRELLPTVRLESDFLCHVRTLWYSSTKEHELIAKVSVNVCDGTNTLRINSLLPSSTNTAHINDLLSPSATATTAPSDATTPSANTALVLPLLASYGTAAPPVREPERMTTTLTVASLFPPCITAQMSPPLAVHVRVPNIRVDLGEVRDLSEVPSVRIVQNSTYILLTTGQTTTNCGVLLKKGRARHDPVRWLEPVPMDASGDVAGVWVRGNAADAATLALYAFAASWRFNRDSEHSNTGEWYEGPVCLVRFLENARVTVQFGNISVCDDDGAHYIAPIHDAAPRDVPFELDSATENSNKDPPQWRSSWVPSPSARDVLASDRISVKSARAVKTPKRKSKSKSKQRSKPKRDAVPPKPRRVSEPRNTPARSPEVGEDIDDPDPEREGSVDSDIESNLVLRKLCRTYLGQDLTEAVRKASSSETPKKKMNHRPEATRNIVAHTSRLVPETPNTIAQSPQVTISIDDPSDENADSEIESDPTLRQLCRKFMGQDFNDLVDKEVAKLG